MGGVQPVNAFSSSETFSSLAYFVAKTSENNNVIAELNQQAQIAPEIGLALSPTRFRQSVHLNCF